MISDIENKKDKQSVNIKYNNIDITITYEEILKIINAIDPDAAYLINYYLIKHKV